MYVLSLFEMIPNIANVAKDMWWMHADLYSVAMMKLPNKYNDK